MSDASIPNQATEPSADVGAAQQSQRFSPPDPGGSALLDATLAAEDTTQPQGTPISDPVASNNSSVTGTGDEKTAGASTVRGPFSTNHSSEVGAVNLHNNPDLPDQSLQGVLPDTDPMKLPIDPETNLPD